MPDWMDLDNNFSFYFKFWSLRRILIKIGETRFLNTHKNYYYQIRIENKVGKKLPQLRTGCVTSVTRILITLYRFINCPNRNINGEIELANL